jgi:hypothetical protein
MVGYYDVVLGLIPVTLVGLTAILVGGGLPLWLSVPLSSTVAVGLIGHAMFVNGPAVAEPTADVPGGSGHRPAD